MSAHTFITYRGVVMWGKLVVASAISIAACAGAVSNVAAAPPKIGTIWLECEFLNRDLSVHHKDRFEGKGVSKTQAFFDAHVKAKNTGGMVGECEEISWTT